MTKQIYDKEQQKTIQNCRQHHFASFCSIISPRCRIWTRSGSISIFVDIQIAAIIAESVNMSQLRLFSCFCKIRMFNCQWPITCNYSKKVTSNYKKKSVYLHFQFNLIRRCSVTMDCFRDNNFAIFDCEFSFQNNILAFVKCIYWQ